MIGCAGTGISAKVGVSANVETPHYNERDAI